MELFDCVISALSAVIHFWLVNWDLIIVFDFYDFFIFYIFMID